MLENMRSKLNKSNRIASVAYESILFLILAFVSLKIITLLSDIRLFYAASWPDPFIYTGYATNYSGLQNRYGGTYYGARISTIIPTWVRVKLDIPDQEFRLFLLSIVSLAFYLAFRIYTNKFRAGLYAVAASNSILFLRYMSDDYTPGFISLYTLITVVALLKSSFSLQYRHFWIMLSGIAAGLAFNSNIMIVILLAPWIIIYLWSQNSLSKSNQFAELRTLILSAASAQIICVLIGLYLGGTASLNNYKATLGAIRNLRLYESLFSRPISQVSSFVFLFICLTLLILWIIAKEAHQSLLEISLSEFRKKKVIYSACVATLSTLFSGFAYYLGISVNWFTTSYYAFLYFPIIILPVYLWLIKKNDHPILPMFSVVGTTLVFSRAHDLTTWSMKDISNLRLVLISFFLILMTLAGVKRIRYSLKLFTIYVIIFSSTFMLTQDWNPYWGTRSENRFEGEFAGFMNHGKQIVNESTQYFAEDFALYLKSRIPESEYYWLIYPKDPNWLLSIDATQLWGYSCFACTDKNGYPIARAFPPTDPEHWPTLITRKYTVIFSSDSAIQEEAVSEYLYSYPMTSIYENRNFNHLNRQLFVTIVKNQ
jgi:hypothetical protein